MRHSTNLPPETALSEALDAIADDLRATLAGLRRPAELVAAENRVIDSRERRAELWEAYRAVSSDLQTSLSRTPEQDARILAAKAAVAAAEGAVNRAQRALGRLRETHGRTICAAIDRHRAAAAAAVAGAADILAVAAAAAAAEHVELPEVITASPALEALATAAYRAAARQRNLADREFGRAAAAMWARGAPRPTSEPTKWKARPEDFGGGVIDDGSIAVPIAPGSSMTTRRIPAAALAAGAPPPAGPLRLSASAVGAMARSVLRKR
jgi:hypothetical protein